MFMAKRCHTMHHTIRKPSFDPAANICNHHITIMDERNIIDYGLKDCIFFVLADLGRKLSSPLNTRKTTLQKLHVSTSYARKRLNAQWIVFYRFANQVTYTLTGQKFLSSLDVASDSTIYIWRPFFSTYHKVYSRA